MLKAKGLETLVKVKEELDKTAVLKDPGRMGGIEGPLKHPGFAAVGGDEKQRQRGTIQRLGEIDQPQDAGVDRRALLNLEAADHVGLIRAGAPVDSWGEHRRPPPA